MSKTFYKGISLRDFEYDKNIRRKNVELVKHDLLNHIFTRRSERVMMPVFGTRIQEQLMEPMDDTSMQIILTDLLNVFNYDPRVELRDLEVRPLFSEKSIIAIAELRYLELNFIDQFEIRLEFES